MLSPFSNSGISVHVLSVHFLKYRSSLRIVQMQWYLYETNATICRHQHKELKQIY